MKQTTFKYVAMWLSYVASKRRTKSQSENKFVGNQERVLLQLLTTQHNKVTPNFSSAMAAAIA